MTDALQPGGMLGHYRLIEKIGEGGMGVVWKAEDTRLGRRVAVKVLSRTYTADPERHQRFHREARAAAALNHPNIITIHEIGEDGTTLYIVMELLEGKSLRDRLRAGPLPAGDLLALAVPIARALAHAHAQGIVHRDLKPENVMFTAEGQVKLLDFGLAKPVRPPGAGDPDGRSVRETISAELTRDGAFAGTVGYMSPEMAAGRGVDARSDQFSLGIVLYEMAAGKRPFAGGTWASTLAKIMEEDPAPLRDLRPEIPAGLEEIIHRCLGKDPEGRYHDTRDLAAALQEVAGTGPFDPFPAPRSRRSPLRSLPAGSRARIMVTVAGITLLALAVLLVARPEYLSRLWPHESPPDTASAPAASSEEVAIAVFPFAFRGDAQFAYLGEGMVNLLGAALDGAGSLRSVDARAILAALRREEGGTPADPGAAGQIAERLGAAHFILGDIVEAGGKFRIQCTLYDTGGGLRAEGRADAEGKADQVFEMVDTVAAQILAVQPGGRPERVTRVAAVTTHSIPALKAYLEGEARFRAGRFAQAVEAFQRAVAEDPTFALAYYRLSIAAEWSQTTVPTREAAEKAVQNADRLSAYDRLLLEALLAWRRGDAPEAERLYRTAIGQHPDDVEAWFQLGEVLFHGGPPRGRSLSESREPFERVLSFEPDHVPSLLHLGRFAAISGDREELARIESRALELNPGGERALEARGMMAYGLGDREMEASVLEEARRATDGEVAIAANTVVIFSGDPRGPAGLVRVLTDPARAPETRTLGRVWLAQTEASHGRLAAARSELEATGSPAPAWAMEARANLLLLPFVPVPRPRLEAMESELSRWDAAAVPESASGLNWVNVHDGLHVHLRLYLLGILNARLGRSGVALENAAAIEGMPAPPVSATLPGGLARSLRAQVAHAQGRGREVMDLLTPPIRDLSYTQGIASPFFSRPQDRWLLAETLESLGRNEEALAWFGSFEAHSTYDQVYLAPSCLRRGRIWEKVGQAGQAAANYRRFLDLWRDADPDLKPLLDEAKAALARLR